MKGDFMANYKRFDFKKLYFILYIVLVLIVVYLLFKLGIFLFPFTLALFFSIMTQPFSRFLEKKLKFSQKIATIVSIVLFLVIFLGFISLSALRLSGEIYKLSINLNKYSKEAQSLWNTAIDKVYSLLGYFPEGFDEQVKNSINGFIRMGTSKLGSFINSLINFITSIPTIILYICITILSTFFISLDKNKIMAFLEQQFPKSWIKKVYNIKREMFNVLGSYIRAQIILMTICFFELLISFNILSFLKFNLQYPLIFSIVICIIDALPILGAGAVLLPWSLISFVTGDINLGLALLVIYFLVLSVRQMLEPKLISQNLGVHPLVTLISMYSGFKFFGVIGFLIGPVVMIILKNVFSRELEIGFFREIFSEVQEDDEKNKSDISKPDNAEKNGDSGSDSNTESDSNSKNNESINEKVKKYIDKEFIEDRKC
jgi:sporulation integral membrane protein ytvI